MTKSGSGLSTLASRLRKVPQSALRAAVGRCEFLVPDREEDDTDETATRRGPIKLTASSGVPFVHPFWGRLVFDFAGMAHGDRLTLDWCHDPDEIVGYADQISTESGQLTIAGDLVSAGDDKAAELLVKGKAGVPYEASVKFDPFNGLQIEELQENMVATVNGQQLAGPLTIIRTCLLRGVAVCPYGADPHTHTEFSQTEADQVEVAIHSQEAEMAETTAPVAAATAAADGRTAEQIRTELREAHAGCVAKYGLELASKWGPLGESELSLDSVHELLQQLRASHGAELEAQRTSHAAALGELQGKLDAQTAAVTELQSRLEQIGLGESSPASSLPAGAATAEEQTQLTAALPPRLARYVAACRARKQAVPA